MSEQIFPCMDLELGYISTFLHQSEEIARPIERSKDLTHNHEQSFLIYLSLPFSCIFIYIHICNKGTTQTLFALH